MNIAEGAGPGGWRQPGDPLPVEYHEGCHDEDDENGHFNDHDYGFCSAHEAAAEEVNRREGEHNAYCPHLGWQTDERHRVGGKPRGVQRDGDDVGEVLEEVERAGSHAFAITANQERDRSPDTRERLPQGDVAVGGERCHCPSDRERNRHGGTRNTCDDPEYGEDPGTDHSADPDTEGRDQPDVRIPVRVCRGLAMIRASAVRAAHWPASAVGRAASHGVSPSIGSKLRGASGFTRSERRTHTSA